MFRKRYQKLYKKLSDIDTDVAMKDPKKIYQFIEKNCEDNEKRLDFVLTEYQKLYKKCRDTDVENKAVINAFAHYIANGKNMQPGDTFFDRTEPRHKLIANISYQEALKLLQEQLVRNVD